MTKERQKKSFGGHLASLVLIISGLGSGLVAAQGAVDEPESYMFYTELYLCDWSRHAEADALFESTLQPVFESAVKDGLILGWAYLKRALGDEWGRGITLRYENGLDIFDLRREFFSRLSQHNDGGLTTWFEICGPHRENIYRATGRP